MVSHCFRPSGNCITRRTAPHRLQVWLPGARIEVGQYMRLSLWPFAAFPLSKTILSSLSLFIILYPRECRKESRQMICTRSRIPKVRVLPAWVLPACGWLSILASNIVCRAAEQQATVHVWEKVEISLSTERSYANPYTDVDVWVDLQGPQFKRRCYGFWDGGSTFRVRVLATASGTWSWKSHCNQSDAGLEGKHGSFKAVAWSEEEKGQNALRRGMPSPSDNGHALNYADGTPCLILGDTWWATPTFRYPWFDDDAPRPLGPQAGFKDYVRYRKQQGFNCVALIAAFPAWARDDQPSEIWIDRQQNLGIRSAWVDQDDLSAKLPRSQWHAKDMYNEGGRPFLFPGKIPGYETIFPDVDRINPEYFRYLDRKLDYLNQQGFVPFLEVLRRDATSAWGRYYRWPESYVRYIQYVWSRYQANICLFSPIHFDWVDMAMKEKDFNGAANLVIEKYGPPPFGTLVSCNSNPSSQVNFGQFADNRWLTLQQIGNRREHSYYWYLTEIFHTKPPRPALNGEPYYAGFRDKGGQKLSSRRRGGQRVG